MKNKIRLILSRLVILLIAMLVSKMNASCQKRDKDTSQASKPLFNNGLALTPPMCFNTWNTFKKNPTESLIKEIADVMVEKGFKAAGYQYANIDDFFSKGRGADGHIIIDSIKFPHGLKAVADYIHSKGLKAGIYTNLGPGSPGYLGSEGYYDQDMKTFASWGFDFIKVDVNTIKDRSEANLRRMFSEFSLAIKNCGRPMVFSICNQGDGNYQNWAPAIGNTWRVGKDIDYISWAPPYQKTQWQGVIYELDHSMLHPELAGPGTWNDADMMLIGVTDGNKLTLLTNDESKSHFSLWCIITSPLIIGADLRTISPEATAILTNKGAIAINQDTYGEQARLVSDTNGLQVYLKHLESATSGQYAVALFNRTEQANKIMVNADMLGLKNKFSVHDLWAKKDMGSFKATPFQFPHTVLHCLN